MSGYTDIREIIVAKVPETGRWGIYRAFIDGRVMLWNTSLIRCVAITQAEADSKKFNVPLIAEPKHA